MRIKKNYKKLHKICVYYYYFLIFFFLPLYSENLIRICRHDPPYIFDSKPDSLLITTCLKSAFALSKSKGFAAPPVGVVVPTCSQVLVLMKREILVSIIQTSSSSSSSDRFSKPSNYLQVSNAFSLTGNCLAQVYSGVINGIYLYIYVHYSM